MEFPRWLTVVVAGQLITGFVHEGWEVEKAKQPHIPEVTYFSYSTKNLTYFVSDTTAGTLAISGDHVRPFFACEQYVFKMPDGSVTLYKLG